MVTGAFPLEQGAGTVLERGQEHFLWKEEQGQPWSRDSPGAGTAQEQGQLRCVTPSSSGGLRVTRQLLQHSANTINSALLLPHHH